VLSDGEYTATCRELTIVGATARGYGMVYPSATMTVKDGWATFWREGTEVWNCNARFAEAHFDIRPAQDGARDADELS
jgi:hypothetical protein